MRYYLSAFILAFLSCVANAEDKYGVGFSRIAADWNNRSMQVSIWYPTPVKGTGFEVGPFEMHGTRDAPVATGQHGIILLSHGTGGSDLSHRNVAAAIARKGFIVVAPLHPGDNFQDQSGFENGEAVIDRPEHLRVALRSVSMSEKWLPFVNSRRLGVFGFSLGGHAAVGLLGGTPKLAQAAVHCRRFSDDPLCQVKRGFGQAESSFVYNEKPDNTLTVCAAYLADPVTAFYSDEDLAALRVQTVVIARPSVEDVLSGETNARRLAHAMSTGGLVSSVSERLVEGAGHYAFLAPFPPSLASTLPRELVTDPDGFDRVQFNGEFSAEVATFFVEALESCS